MNQTMQRIADATARARQDDTFTERHISHAYSVRREGEQVTVRYHSTDMAVFDGAYVRINNDGFYTPTSKNVLNAALAHTPYSVYQKDFNWYIAGYSDGVVGDYANDLILPLTGDC